MKQSFILILAIIMFASSCAKKGVTPARVQLHVGGIVSPGNTIGTGGGILFGRSKTGESFAQIISGTEENIELSNGDWSFSALMWDNVDSIMGGVVYCGNSATQTLSGTDATVNLSLTNSLCSDPVFSSGQIYTDSYSMIHFSDVYLEECDELNANSFTCGLSNQGSARSYKVVFTSYKKSASGAVTAGATQLSSRCMKSDRTSGIIGNALPINIPGGTSTLAIPLEIKMYLGSDTCDDADSKGVFKVALDQGIATQASSTSTVAAKLLSYNPNNCDISSSAVVGTTPEETRKKCEDLLGQVDSVGACDTFSIPRSVTRFAPAAYCSTPPIAVPGYPTPASSPVYPAIKHMVAISKASLCAPYLQQSISIGSFPFSGGNGTLERPFKICTEWQLNQIGEPSAPSTFASSSYKLMNDLDMNLVDIGGKDTTTPLYSKPSCAFAGSQSTPSDLDSYHNLNSLDQLVDANCSQIPLASANALGFSGTFDGNNKTISNGRIFGRNVDGVGFVRKLQAGGVIKNLKFNFLMSQARSLVGSIAGEVFGPNAEIHDILLDRINVSADDRSGSRATGSIIINSYVGGIAGKIANASFIRNVQVKGSVKGGDYVGGLVGELNGKISKSSFRGDVRQDGNHGGNAGGIAAAFNPNNQSGTYLPEISDSFSEGTLEADTRHLGGIAGYSNGSILRSYSNMLIKVKNNFPNYPGTTDYYAGGLVGYSDNSSNVDVYFAGRIDLNNPGNPGSIYNGVIGGTGASASFQNCVTSMVTSGVAGCTSLQGTDSLQTGAVSQLTAAVYTQQTGSLPHLTWEQRPCKDASNLATIPIQASAGKGAIDNPIVICNASQLSQISGRAATENYILGDDISLASWSASSLITDLNGSLDGNNKLLYGLNIVAPTTYSGSTLSLIGTIQPTGKVKNLSIVKSSIDGLTASSVTYMGLLAGVNSGTISNVNLNDVFTMSIADKSGLVAGRNTGTISQISIGNGIVKAKSRAGLLVGEASATSIITKADVRGTVSLSSMINAIPIFGGIVGSNDGSIDQARFQGEVSTLVSTLFVPGSMQGGITGYNAGSVSNVLVDNWSSINFMFTQYVGGLVGYNQGTVSKAINLGLISSYDTSFGSSHYFLPLAGVSSGGAQTSDSYFLENMIGTVVGNPPSANLISATATLDQNNVPISCDSPYNITFPYLTAGDPLAADLFILDGFGNKPTVNMIAITGLISGQTGSIFKYLPYNNGQCVPANSQVKFYKSLALSSPNTTGILSPSVLNNVSTYSNFNMAGKDSNGNKLKEVELLGYFKSLMYQQPAPATAPLWQIDGDPYPSLLQLQKL